MAKFQLNDFSKRKLRKLAALTSEINVLQRGLSDRRNEKLQELQTVIRAQHTATLLVSGRGALLFNSQEQRDQFAANDKRALAEFDERISELTIEIAELESRQEVLNGAFAPTSRFLESLLKYADRPDPEFNKNQVVIGGMGHV